MAESTEVGGLPLDDIDPGVVELTSCLSAVALAYSNARALTATGRAMLANPGTAFIDGYKFSLDSAPSWADWLEFAMRELDCAHQMITCLAGMVDELLAKAQS